MVIQQPVYIIDLEDSHFSIIDLEATKTTRGFQYAPPKKHGTKYDSALLCDCSLRAAEKKPQGLQALFLLGGC